MHYQIAWFIPGCVQLRKQTRVGLLGCVFTLGLLVNSTPAADSPAYDAERFEATVLLTALNRPMELAVAPDGRVYFIELDGLLRLLNPADGSVQTIGQLKVTTENENGLIGIALDPHFANNQWIYLQYSPPGYPGQHISRFTLFDGKLDLATEKLLFKFEEQRKECCHHAGALEFGPDGCLYIATGDNTHPHGDSQGYAPLDERPGRAPWDAQKSAANSRSGSGKILRIKPTDDGGYSIPDGNLFPKDGSQGMPEIYVMGCRNPWRMSVDQATGFVYWGEVGPDAGGDGPRGPRGYDEINQARSAGFFGWPYFIANNLAYAPVDFATGKVGEKFDPARPVNNSVNNTGLRELPPAQPALLYYPYGKSEEFPELGEGSRTACAGPVYHYDPQLKSDTKFPAYFDRVLFIYEWSRHWIKAVHLDASGNVVQIEPFMPSQRFVRPIDMQFGPDGALYLIEYGETWGRNADARLVRIDYFNGNRRPVAKAAAENNIGRQPLKVVLSSEGTFDKDPGEKLRYQWRALRAGHETAEPRVLSTEPNCAVEFSEPGVFNVELIVTDSLGAVGTATVPVLVGNSRPALRFNYPTDGSFFDPTVPLEFSMYVRDAEDGTSDYDEADTEDIEFIDNMAHARLSVNAAALPTPLFPVTNNSDTASMPAGLRLMKNSDCFNCHYTDQKRVGPPLVEIAEKYRDQPGALEASIKRVREGSTGVWGKVPMLPHQHHTHDELAAMVTWIYSLRRDSTPRVFQGFSGEVPPATDEAARFANLSLDATYTDRGAGDVPPLNQSAAVRLRSRLTNAELADQVSGPLTLKSASAIGGAFLGGINHGHYARFCRVPLEQVGKISVRVSSAGAGGQIVVHLDSPDGPVLTAFNVRVNGHWENWYELTNEFTSHTGQRDLVFVFENPERQQALMNLDSVYFHPRDKP